MPALLVTIAAVLVLACLVYFPSDLRQVPIAVACAALFASNLWYFHTTGYFAGGADTKPLLHTWSLAVEEQFYIGFPILLLIVARFAPRLRNASVAAVALLSFVIACATQAKADGFAFYLLPPRAWELFAGALLALGAVPPLRGPRAREAVALTGVAVIAAAVLVYTSATQFPGVAALPPVLGAAAVLYAAQGTRTGALLSAPPLVAIGLISYSLYLWHWPVIVFAGYLAVGPIGAGARLAEIALSAGLAVLSWRFVERPFRNRARIGRQGIFLFTGAAILAVCVSAWLVARRDGWTDRFPTEVRKLAEASGDISPRRARCHDAEPDRGRPFCVLGAPVAPDAMLWGDSHGVELAYALGEVRARRGASLVQRTASSCPPVTGDGPVKPACAALNRATLAAIRGEANLRTVYLAAYWSAHRDDPPEFWRGLDTTIGALIAAGKQVILIGAFPSPDFDVPRRLARLSLDHRLGEATGLSRATHRADTRALAAVARHWRDRGVVVVDPADLFCDARQCRIIEQGKPLSFDTNHPSLTAARMLAAVIDARERAGRDANADTP